MRYRSIFPLCLAATLLAACQTTPAPIEAAATEAGLHRVELSEFDAFYSKPGATFSGYSKVLLRPVEVSFRESWTPRTGAAQFEISEQDKERIREKFAATFMDVFEDKLQANGRYELVSEPGPDVLELQLKVVDLYIPAPDLSRYSPMRIRSFTREGSEMTLIAQVYDSTTGQLLSHAYDERRAPRTADFQLTNEITNTADARRIIRSWAEELRSTFERNTLKSPS